MGGIFQQISGKIFFAAAIMQGLVGTGHAQSSTEPRSNIASVQLPNVNREELDRFLAASMMFSMPSRQKIVAYEMITRCSIEIPVGPDGSTLGQPALYSLGRDYVSAVAPAIAANTAIEITTMLSGESEPQQDRCTNRIRGYFGSQYEEDGAQLRPLIKRAVEILKGAPLDQGANRVTDLTARNATETARQRVAAKIKSPLFVGAVQAPGHVAVLVGEPGATIRWVVQFAQVQGGYELEGGIEAGVSDEIQ